MGSMTLVHLQTLAEGLHFAATAKISLIPKYKPEANY